MGALWCPLFPDTSSQPGHVPSLHGLLFLTCSPPAAQSFPVQGPVLGPPWLRDSSQGPERCSVVLLMQAYHVPSNWAAEKPNSRFYMTDIPGSHCPVGSCSILCEGVALSLACHMAALGPHVPHYKYLCEALCRETRL